MIETGEYNPKEIDNALEREITRGYISYISGIESDLIKRRLTLCFVNDPDDRAMRIARILIFENVTDLIEESHEAAEDNYLESLIGLDAYIEPEITRYVIVTDIRELRFQTDHAPICSFT